MILPSTEDDAYHLSTRLREADLLDVAVAAKDPLDALLDPIDTAQTVFVDDEPCMMFGLVPQVRPSGIVFGVVWLLGSDLIDRVRMRFLRECKAHLDELAQGCHATGNIVHAANTLHIRWLRWLGYSFLRRTQVNGHWVWEFCRAEKHV